MSNFNCEHCGTPILEGEGGVYVTWCEHYPLEPSQQTKDALWDALYSSTEKISRGRITKKRIDRL